EAEPWLSKWKAWLGGGPIAPDDRDIAQQIAEMVLFDTVSANWDRWSGANVGMTRRRDGTIHPWFVDKDGAFYEKPPAAALDRQLALVKEMRRFPRALVDALRKLDRSALATAIGAERPG